MKEYEVIWEIFNKCPRNQMRDVFVEEVEIADPEVYVKAKFQERMSHMKNSARGRNRDLRYCDFPDKAALLLYRDLGSVL